MAVWAKPNRIAEIALVSNEGNAEVRWDRSILIWDAETGQRVATQFAPQASGLAASPDGSWILEAGQDRRVRFRGADKGDIRPEDTLRVHDGPVTCAIFHPTLPYFVTASEDLTVKIWSVETRQLVEDLGVLRRVPVDLLISADGTTLGVSYQKASNLTFFAPKSFQSKGR
jgi:WD40 repeat protein